MDFANKTAIVTGGNKGIGLAVAQRLGRQGARIAICARTEKSLRRAADRMQAEGIEVFQKRCDVSSQTGVEAFVGEAVGRYGRVDFLVNNAGTTGPTPIAEPDHQVWDRVIRVNLDGAYFMTTSCTPHMPDGGRIVNISSILGKFGVPGFAAYCASKHGLIGLTRVCAMELAPRKITVNAICPGWVETDMARLAMERGAEASASSYEDFRKSALSQVPLGDIVQPDEVAGLVHFLLTPEAANITAQSYSICGGQTV